MIDLHITANLSVNTLQNCAQSFELKATLIRCIGRSSYLSNPTPLLNYTWKLFCDSLRRSAPLKESKEFLHTEFYFQCFSLQHWHKVTGEQFHCQETCVASFYTVSGLNRKFGFGFSFLFVKWLIVWEHVFIEHWGSCHIFLNTIFLSVQHVPQKSFLQYSRQSGERHRRNINKVYLPKKILHLPVCHSS